MGGLRSMTVALNMHVGDIDLPVLSRFLNEHLQGVSVEDLAMTVGRKLQTFLDEQRRLAEQALQVLRLMPSQGMGRLFLEGATQLFEQPEFRDIAKAREVFGLLEEENRVMALLRSAARECETHGTVIIGGEKGLLDGVSVVAAPYEVNGKPVGMVGVLGPQRMPYPKLTAIVDYTATMVTRMLARLGR